MTTETQFDSMVSSVAEQIETVTSAPVPFSIMLAIASFAVWKIIDHHYLGRIAAKDDLLALREAQLQDYKDKLSGASPDAAKARMDALESRLEEVASKTAAMAPRRLTETQRRAMTKEIDPCRGSHIEIASDATASDAGALSRDLAAVFNGAAWHVRTALVMGIGIAPKSGIGLRVADVSNLSQDEQCVVNALRAADLSFDLIPGQGGGAENEDRYLELLLTTPY